MKTVAPIYALLLAVYPVIDLYSILPGGVQLGAIRRPIFFQVVLTLILFFLFYVRQKDMLRAGFLAGFAIFYFSSTGYFYRSIPLRAYPAGIHLFFVLLGLALLGILWHPLVWQKYLQPNRLRQLTHYLNFISVVVFVFPLYRIGNVLIKATDDTKVPWKQIVIQNQEPQPLHPNTPLDVYYIILDGYARQDVLQDVFGYDNSHFIEELEHMGFYVAKDSHSNYLRTVVSLPSSLNFDYINFTEQTAGRTSTNYLPLVDLLQHSQTRILLEQAGYTIIATSTDHSFTDWQDADIYLSPSQVELNDVEKFFYASSALGAFYDTEFPFSPWLRSVLPLFSYGTRRDKILFAFAQLKEIPKIPGPKFVFVHIIAPHPPFVLDAEGKPVKIDRPFDPNDGDGYTGTIEEYQKMYIKQLKFVNSQTVDAIKSILEQSSQPPIIILQGDHGSGSLLKNSSIQDSCLFERSSILNAYYMPRGKTELLYPEITPVNSFRVIFNTYFGTEYPLREDRIYYTPYVNPYYFIEITDRIEDKCQSR